MSLTRLTGRHRVTLAVCVCIISAALVWIGRAAAADTRPAFLPSPPRPVVLWHCGPDVTSGRAVLVHRGGRTYDLVAKGAQFAGGRVVARCVPVIR